MASTLQTIRNKIRNITGRVSSDQLSNAALDNYINNFYLYDFPEHLKTINLDAFITFNLEPNVDTYGSPQFFSEGVLDFKIPAYISGYQLSLWQSPDQFYKKWPILKFIQQVGAGNGGPTYTFTLTNTPLLPNSLLVSASETFNNALTANDNGNGGFVGDVVSGSVDYETGVVSITFNGDIPAGNTLYAQHFPYVASRPFDVLYYEHQFVFRPVPDQAYEFKISALLRPTELIEDTQQPLFEEWGDVIAYGAALKIAVEDSDFEQYARLYPIFQQQYLLSQRRTLKQLSTQRVATPYSREGYTGAPAWNIYPNIG